MSLEDNYEVDFDRKLTIGVVGRKLKLSLDGWQLFDKRFGKMLREMKGDP